MLSCVLTMAVATPVAMWPLERQDRYGTGRAVVASLPAAQYSTPWREKDLSNGFIVSHGPSLGADGNGYFGTWVGNTVFRFKIATNTVNGSFAAGNFVTSTPAIGSGRIFAATDSGKVYGINPANMSGEWANNTSYISGSPNLGADGGLVYCQIDGTLTRRRYDGSEYWAKTGYSNAHGTVVFTRDDLSVIVSHDKVVSRVRWSDGSPEWTYPTGFVTGAPAVAPDGTIVFGNDNGDVYGLHPDGTLAWHRITAGEVRAPAAFAANGDIYVGSYDYSLYAYDQNGNFKWSYPTTLWVNEPVSIGFDGRLYFHNKGGELYCLNSNGGLIWHRAVGGESRGPLTIGAQSTLYVPFAADNKGLYVVRQDAPYVNYVFAKVGPGTHTSGDGSSLKLEDGNVFQLLSYVTVPINKNVSAEFQGVAPKDRLDSFVMRLKVTAQTYSMILKSELYNYTTQSWDLKQTAALQSGTVRLLNIGVTANNAYVETGTKKMRIRLTATPTVTPTEPYSLDIDQLTNRVVPSW